jgi:putative hydrolase of the HAD superfamily
LSEISDKIDVVLFDGGGVLVELQGIPTMLGWLDNSTSIDELWRLWLTSPVVRRFETGRATPDEFAHEIIQEMSLPVSPEEFIARFQSWFTGLYPGALEVVRSVPARFTRATLCNTNVLHWPRMIAELNLDQDFQRHFASHLTGKIKPDREAFENVLDTLGCQAGAVFFLDDNILNVEAARNVGMHAVQTRGPAEAQRALVEAGIVSS